MVRHGELEMAVGHPGETDASEVGTPSERARRQRFFKEKFNIQ